MQARVQGMRAMMRVMQAKLQATQGIKTCIDPLRGSPIFHCFPTPYLVFMAIHAFSSLDAILNFQWMTSFVERSYTWPKWLPKMKALLTLILQCVHIKRNVFTLYQEEYFLYTMSLWVCYRNFKAFVQRYSWIDDIEGKRELI